MTAAKEFDIAAVIFIHEYLFYDLIFRLYYKPIICTLNFVGN